MTNAPAVRAVKRALPEHVHTQDEILAAARERWSEAKGSFAMVERFFASTLVRTRHLAIPLERYGSLRTFAEANDEWIRAALDLCERASRDALDAAGVRAEDVDHVFFVSTTGIATPSIDARLANRIGLPVHVRRTPVFGLGCAGGAAGLGRAADWLRAYPDAVALVVAVELCSLTMQRDDVTVPNLIASALFGDGAAAVVLTGASRADASDGPRVVSSRCAFFPDTEHVMGWEVRDSGFGVLLTTDVPILARERVPAIVDAALAEQGLTRGDVGRWIFHSGGPRVLDAFEEGLGLRSGALAVSRRCLEHLGNLSSVTVLVVLEDHLAAAPPRGDTNAILMSMGPGFSAELSLLRW